MLTPGYGAGVQLEFFVVFTTKKADGTEVAHEPIVSYLLGHALSSFSFSMNGGNFELTIAPELAEPKDDTE